MRRFGTLIGIKRKAFIAWEAVDYRVAEHQEPFGLLSELFLPQKKDSRWASARLRVDKPVLSLSKGSGREGKVFLLSPWKHLFRQGVARKGLRPSRVGSIRNDNDR